MNFDLSSKPIKEVKADLEIVIVIDKNLDHHFVQDKKLLKRAGFSAAHEETCLLADKKRLYIGSESIKSTDIRPAIAVAIRSLEGTTFKHATIASYMSHPKCTAVLRGMVEGIILGAYSFDTYKSKKSKRKLKDITISLEEYHDFALDQESCQRALDNARIGANATNYTRDIVNTSPDDCYPDAVSYTHLTLPTICSV